MKILTGMKTNLCKSLLASIFGMLLASLAFGSAWKVGDEFPVTKLKVDSVSADATIVAFMPSATYECEYASMMTQAFFHYLDRKLAFENLPVTPRIRVVLVVADREDLAKSSLNRYGDMKVIFDEKGEILKELGMSRPSDKNADSTVVLLDRNNRVAMVDEKYRAQGEHLKPLEHKIRKLIGAELNLDGAELQKPLKIGNKAPDFQINARERLSDLRGSVVLISFYPAAFSGSFPRPVEDASVVPRTSNPIVLNDVASMSCIFQIDGIDVSAKGDARRIVVSSSTPSLLEEWRNVLDTTKVEFANDPDYAVARQYASLNPLGYHRRVSVIVGRDGRIKYVDMDFQRSDELVIEEKITKLLKSKK